MTAKTSNNDYPGDTAWFDYVESLRPIWNSYSKKAELTAALSGQEDLAIAAYFAAGQHALDWVEKLIPALNMESPRSLAGREEKRNSLRSMLMKMSS